MTLRHVVLFSFPDELSELDAADMKIQIQAWPETTSRPTPPSGHRCQITQSKEDRGYDH